MIKYIFTTYFFHNEITRRTKFKNTTNNIDTNVRQHTDDDVMNYHQIFSRGKLNASLSKLTAKRGTVVQLHGKYLPI